MRFASFLSGGFTAKAVTNPLKRKLAKHTSVQCLPPKSPKVRLKMNDKKPSKFQFYFSGVLKNEKKNFASLDLEDNPIYPISNPDGQDRKV